MHKLKANSHETLPVISENPFAASHNSSNNSIQQCGQWYEPFWLFPALPLFHDFMELLWLS